MPSKIPFTALLHLQGIASVMVSILRFITRSTESTTPQMGLSFNAVLRDRSLMASLEGLDPATDCDEENRVESMLVDPESIDPNEVCAICLGNFTEGTPCKLSCGHFLHSNCLQQLCDHRSRSRRNTLSCPLCRRTLNVQLERRELSTKFKASL